MDWKAQLAIAIGILAIIADVLPKKIKQKDLYMMNSTSRSLDLEPEEKTFQQLMKSNK